MTFRRANYTDVAEITAVLLQTHDESSKRSMAIDTEKGASYLRSCIDSPRHFCAVWRNDDRKLCGILVGFMATLFFFDELGAWDLLFYVRPQDLGSRIAVDLWSGFRAWSEQSAARTLWLGQPANVAPRHVRRFYTRLGITEPGALYRMCNCPGQARSYHKASYGDGTLVPWRHESRR